MIDLTRFCSKDDTRFHIQQPFSKGDYTYATDGCIAVRVSRTDVPENAEAPDAEKLFAAAIARGEPPWTDLPPFELERKRCPDCEGLGFYDKHGTPCSDSIGADECLNCQGGVIYSGSVTVSTKEGDVRIAARYLDLLKDLPEIKIGLFGDESKLEKPMRFKFDGGDGLLMPIRS